MVICFDNDKINRRHNPDSNILISTVLRSSNSHNFGSLKLRFLLNSRKRKEIRLFFTWYFFRYETNCKIWFVAVNSLSWINSCLRSEFLELHSDQLVRSYHFLVKWMWVCALGVFENMPFPFQVIASNLTFPNGFQHETPFVVFLGTGHFVQWDFKPFVVTVIKSNPESCKHTLKVNIIRDLYLLILNCFKDSPKYNIAFWAQLLQMQRVKLVWAKTFWWYFPSILKVCDHFQIWLCFKSWIIFKNATIISSKI